jgi:Protein of unknown function (DUF3102)
VRQNRKNELVTVAGEFDYGLLDSKIAEQLRSAAKRIRERVKRTLEAIIEIGRDLLRAKESVAHGQFGPWLQMEFGWSDRTARNFMEVAEVFGPKSEIISDLAIVPTAAYLLAAPSTPYEARQIALDRAQSGETITSAVAKEIVGAARTKTARKVGIVPTNMLSVRLGKALEAFKKRWDPKEVQALVRQLQEFVHGLESGMTGGRKGRKARNT